MRFAISRRGLLAGAAALAAPSIARAQGQAAGGVALVIGNSKYSWEAPLPNVRRDVAAVARRLQAYGLKTELLEDSGRDAMRRGIDAFIASVRGARQITFAVISTTLTLIAVFVPISFMVTPVQQSASA